jgi:hypothetical protein
VKFGIAPYTGPGASNLAQTLPQVLSVFPYPFLSLSPVLSFPRGGSRLEECPQQFQEPIFNFYEDGQQSAWQKEQFSLPFRPTLQEQEKCRRPLFMMWLNGLNFSIQCSASKRFWLPVLVS